MRQLEKPLVHDDPAMVVDVAKVLRQPVADFLLAGQDLMIQRQDFGGYWRAVERVAPEKGRSTGRRRRQQRGGL